jgi:hypothetical protein
MMLVSTRSTGVLIWLTYLSTAATIGETVTAAVTAVAASIVILVDIVPRAFSENTAIPSMGLGGEA